MGVINHENQTTGKTEDAGQLGSVTEGTGQSEIQGQLGSNVPKTAETTTPVADAGTSAAPQGKEKLLVLDGPLSEIYTKALNVVYANRAQTNVGQETQQMDSVLVADAHRLEEKEKERVQELQENQEGAYVYVTDEVGLKGDGLTKAFDTLNIALDMKAFKTKALCVESLGTISKNMSLLCTYARDNKMQVFFSREATINMLKAF